jgi:DeoR/GlpR family transcriptional regulator of sugar metabolism
VSTMPPALRRARILERIQRDGGVSIADLARDLTVSSITVHRDLEHLSKEGLVERVHGGARALAGSPSSTAIPPTGWEQRTAQAGAAKAAIAAHAVREIRSGSTIFLDSSSTCLAVARALVNAAATELTLVTNSPAIAYELVDERVLVIVPPGELDQHMRLLAGRWTTDFLSGLNFELAFCSAAGVTLESGLTTSRRALADVINVARANAERSIGLIDSTKFGRSSLLTIAQAQDLDAVITDDGLDDATAREYRAAGVQLEIVTT